MITLFILDVPEFQPVAEQARLSGQQSRRVGDYVEVTSSEDIVVNRREARVRRAVWYSAIGGLAGGEVVAYDSESFRIKPS